MTDGRTSSLATAGELDRYPAHISIVSKIIKFWHHMANLDKSCLLKQAYDVELSNLNRNSDQRLKFVYDIIKLFDMKDYFLDPLNEAHHSLLIKSPRFWKNGLLNFGQVFATLMLKAVVINTDCIGIKKNRISSRVI